MIPSNLKRGAMALPIIVPILVGGCVSQSTYDQLAAQNQQLQQQIASDQAHISRLRGAIKYTVNSDLLFPSGSWEMSADGKDIIAKVAQKLAAEQQEKLIVNGYTDNAPIGAALKARGVTSNQILSEKRAQSVMQYMITQGVKPEMVTARGFGEADPIGSNSTAQGRAQNRRVEITLAGGNG
jgi:chemotaxis protein MotB